ncbi:hypothetical protein GYA28_02590 [Candidatus Roizmanbacteria bacterium]|jgi:hypothetical protein|nr:hypothetical protein [Candidatus Roizmanbacteria bacterium]
MLSPVKIWRRQKEIRLILGKKGKIISWTKILTPPPDFKKYAPYAVVLVDFGDGTKAFGQLVDYEDRDLATGKKVKAVLRKIRDSYSEGVIAYGIKFRPI